MGRGGFKQPGYRTVKRIGQAQEGARLSLYARRVHGEWRLIEQATEAEHTFEETLSAEHLVDSEGSDAAITFRPWTSADLQGGAWDAPLVVWEWCRGVPEHQGNLLTLSDEWWCPYQEETNGIIEAAFQQASEPDVEISILDRKLSVVFTPGSSFALQKDRQLRKERQARRVIKTSQELRMGFDRMNRQSTQPPDLSKLLPNAIPHSFLCPIMQDIMQNPVKTVDGFTYERDAIETWFNNHNTSPLTNLNMPNKTLSPNVELKAQIDAFLASLPAAGTVTGNDAVGAGPGTG